MLAEQSKQAIWEDVWVPTACDMCYNYCSVRARRVNGVVVKIEGVPGAQPNYGKVCAKGNAALMNLYNPRRITRPLLRTNPDKGIGVDPGWRPISWDEAMDLAVARLRAAREKDPRSLFLLSFDTIVREVRNAFTTAFGTPNSGPGASNFFCGRGHHPVSFMLTGSNDLHPDLRYADFVLMFGTAYGFVSQHNAMGMTTEMAEARARGLKLVVVDPVCTYAASKADEWIPIRPGTDGAMILAMANVLVNELTIVDVEYLKLGTNAPYLVGPDGHYLRDQASGKPLVWDERAGRAAPYDSVPPPDAALEGSYRVGGVEARTGFQLYREHLKAYTPERAETITTVPARTIRRLAEEFGRAARVGATISLDGETFPYRPAVVCWYRGLSAHKHALQYCMAAAQLMLVVGAIDVPGGMINGTAWNPFWKPEVGPDCFILPGSKAHALAPLPRRKVQEPESLQLIELFPLAFGSGTMMWLRLANPELSDQLKLPYEPEVFIHCRTNLMATGADPAVIAGALERVRFQISMATHHDETTAFADLILPDAHALERLGGMAYNTFTAPAYMSAARPGEEWALNVQQPVVPPAGEARFWGAVLVEFAYHLGLVEEFNQAFNVAAGLAGDLRLELNRQYTWPELLDRHLKQLVGKEHGLDYLRAHGYYSTGVKRSAIQSYPQRVHGARVPLYLEHFLAAGEEVRQYMDARGIDWWDTSDYAPLVDWKPCSTSRFPPEYDLFVVNQKVPFLTFSFTQHNAWLTELAERNGKVYPVAMNAGTARRRGIADGDQVRLETPSGRAVTAVVRVTEGIHPDCLAIAGIVGRQLGALPPSRRQGVHFNRLVDYNLETFDFTTGAVDACVKVKLTRRPVPHCPG